MTAKLVSKASRLSSKGTLDAAAASRLQGALAGDDDNPLFLGGIRVPPAQAITDAMGTAIATGLTVMPLSDMCSDACWPPQSNVMRLSCHVCIAIPSDMVALQLSSGLIRPVMARVASFYDMLKHVSSISSHTNKCVLLVVARTLACSFLLAVNVATALRPSLSVICRNLQSIPTKRNPQVLSPFPFTHT